MPKATCNVEKCNRESSALGMCNLHYQRQLSGRPLIQPEKVVHETCTVEGCDKKPRSTYAELCGMHYHRLYRHGGVDRTARDISVAGPRRYRTVQAPGHPLAGANGKAYEHRVVLYDEIGPGPHACHWCGESIDWLPKGAPGELQPDHLNNDGGDNRPENLVPSCRRCNITRAIQRRSDALRERGWWSVNDTIAELKGTRRAARIEAA